MEKKERALLIFVKRINVLWCDRTARSMNTQRNDEKAAFETVSGLSQLEYHFQRFGHDSYL